VGHLGGKDLLEGVSEIKKKGILDEGDWTRQYRVGRNTLYPLSFFLFLILIIVIIILLIVIMLVIVIILLFFVNTSLSIILHFDSFSSFSP
jgi:ABC-type multidrug transport system permease subunit